MDRYVVSTVPMEGWRGKNNFKNKQNQYEVLSNANINKIINNHYDLNILDITLTL